MVLEREQKKLLAAFAVKSTGLFTIARDGPYEIFLAAIRRSPVRHSGLPNLDAVAHPVKIRIVKGVVKKAAIPQPAATTVEKPGQMHEFWM